MSTFSGKRHDTASDAAHAASPAPEPNALLGLLALAALQLAGDALVRMLGLPIPGAIVGLLLLLILRMRGYALSAIEAGARLLLKYLPMFLVPVCVGIMDIVPVAAPALPRLLLTLLAAVALGVVLTAWITQQLMTRPSGTNTER